MACLFCGFKFLACCGCRECIIGKYAFYPPKPPSYSFRAIPNYIEANSEKRKHVGSGSSDSAAALLAQRELAEVWDNRIAALRPQEFILIGEDGSSSQLPNIPDLQVVGFNIDVPEGRSQRSIASIFIRYLKQPSEYVIMFSHGNSTDLGYMLDNFLDLAFNCKINVFAYEYSGYGLSQGKASDIGIIKDCRSAYSFLNKQLKYEWSKIILYGQSLGTGPTTYLASHFDYPVAGAILHSGYSSGLRIMIRTLQETHSKDFFPNVELAKYVKCPVFIIHGSRDREIDVTHSESVYESLQNKTYPPWYVENAGHNGIESAKESRREYFIHLRDFFEHVRKSVEGKTPKELLQQNRADTWSADFQHIYKDAQLQRGPSTQSQVSMTGGVVSSSKGATLGEQMAPSMLSATDQQQRQTFVAAAAGRSSLSYDNDDQIKQHLLRRSIHVDYQKVHSRSFSETLRNRSVSGINNLLPEEYIFQEDIGYQAPSQTHKSVQEIEVHEIPEQSRNSSAQKSRAVD